MRLAWLAIGAAWAATAGADVLYRLPWADGRSFMFIQAPGGRVTTHFTKATLHAVDIAMPEGTPVVAAREGVVEALAAHHAAHPEEEPLTHDGNFVRVRHADGSLATYAHLGHRRIVVAVGDTVARGQLVGYSGASGDVEAPHLHFAVTTRMTNSAGWEEELSLPLTFYVGEPPMKFPPRAALRVAADYSAGAQFPRAASELPLLSWRPAAPAPGEERAAWTVLALWLGFGIAAFAWFANFARK